MDNSDAQDRQIAESISDMVGSDQLLSNVRHDPALFLLTLHERWKAKGGRRADGKTRHSDTELSRLLKQNGIAIASLPHKLRGHTRLKSADIKGLIEVILTHWQLIEFSQNGAELTSDFHYDPLVPRDVARKFADVFVEKIRGPKNPRAKLLLEPRKKSDSEEYLIGDSAEIIIDRFATSKALITVSALSTLIVTSPDRALIGFRDLINELWHVDKHDDMNRVLIWVVDIGKRSFQRDGSHLQFLNVDSLATRFRALRDFDDYNQKERWEWLNSRVVIIVGSLSEHEIENNYKNFAEETAILSSDVPQKDREFFLLRNIPVDWMTADGFWKLFGDNRENFRRRSSHTIFCHGGDNNIDNVSYYTHAQYEESDGDISVIKGARGVELPSPGSDYDDSFQFLCKCALSRLGLNGDLPEIEELIEFRQLGFGVLKLSEFLEIQA